VNSDTVGWPANPKKTLEWYGVTAKDNSNSELKEEPLQTHMEVQKWADNKNYPLMTSPADLKVFGFGHPITVSEFTY
jgi:hypothetical protein